MVLLAMVQEDAKDCAFISNIEWVTEFLQNMDCVVHPPNEDSQRILRCPLNSPLSPIYVNIAMEEEKSIVGIYFGTRFRSFLEEEGFSLENRDNPRPNAKRPTVRTHIRQMEKEDCAAELKKYWQGMKKHPIKILLPDLVSDEEDAEAIKLAFQGERNVEFEWARRA